MTNGPALWDRILTPVRDAFGPAFIGGGAVRDYLLGEVPKDIDVFVNVGSGEELRELARRLPPNFSVSLLREPTEYETNPDWVHEVSGVLDGVFTDDADDIFGGISVQIIGRPSADFSPETVVSRFDFGITRCWYDGELHQTPECREDIANSTATLLRADTREHVEASLRRFARWDDRSPGKLKLIRQ